MLNTLPYPLLANLVLLLHVAVMLFIVGGLLLIVAGNLRRWPWVNAGWFRITHLAAIGFVAAQSWLGVTCPLTSLEMALRLKAQASTYNGGFIEFWLQRLLYVDAPPWVFVVAYSVFGFLVLASWLWVPPRFKSRSRSAESP